MSFFGLFAGPSRHPKKAQLSFLVALALSSLGARRA